jgi:hypothetical protein
MGRKAGEGGTGALLVQNDACDGAQRKVARGMEGEATAQCFHLVAPYPSKPTHILTLSDLLDHAIAALARKDLGVLDDAPVQVEDGGGGGRGGNRGGRRHGRYGMTGLVVG